MTAADVQPFARVGVIGAGAWGTAIALAALDELKRLARDGIGPAFITGDGEDVFGRLLHDFARYGEPLQDDASLVRPAPPEHDIGAGRS